MIEASIQVHLEGAWRPIGRFHFLGLPRVGEQILASGAAEGGERLSGLFRVMSVVQEAPSSARPSSMLLVEMVEDVDSLNVPKLEATDWSL